MIPLRSHPGGTPLMRGRRISASVGFARGPDRTWITSQFTPHPFHITRPFWRPGDPDGMATLYLQSSSGGLYGDDDLSLSIRVGAGAAAHVTTQASTVVHHARGGETCFAVEIDAAEDSLVEYMPDPAILFAGARLDTRLSVRLEPGARAIFADATLCHDPAGADGSFASLTSETRITGPDGDCRLIERIGIDGAAWRTRVAPWAACATVYVAGSIDPGRVAADVQAGLENTTGIWAGASAFADREIVVVRLLAEDGAALTAGLAQAWAAARTALTGSRPGNRKK